MRGFKLLLALAILVSGSIAAHAGEAKLKLTSEFLRDDNVFGVADNAIGSRDGDWSFRLAPSLTVEEERGVLTWSFNYTPSFEYFIEHAGLRGLDHDVRGEVSWRLTPRTTITVSDRYRRFGLVSRFNETTDFFEDDEPVTETRTGRQVNQQNRARLGITHQFNRRNLISIGATHLLFDRELSSQADQESYGANIGHLYAWTPRTRFGPSFAWTRRIQKVPLRPNTETDFFNLSLRVIHTIDPTLQLDMSAGPAWVALDDPSFDSSGAVLAQRFPGTSLLDVRTCPTLDDGTTTLGASCEPLDLFANAEILNETTILPQNIIGPMLSTEERETLSSIRSSQVILPFERNDEPSDELTYFADITLRKSWDSWQLAIGYRRSDDSGSSSTGLTSVADRVFANINWRASERLRLDFSASWRKREQEQDVASLATGLGSRSLFFESRECAPPSLIAALGSVAACSQAGLISGRLIRFDNIAEAISVQQVLTGRRVENTLIRLRLGARYRLNRQAVLLASATWRQEKNTGDLAFERVIERLSFRLGIEYEFEPFRF